jgi:hypothetical protein
MKIYLAASLGAVHQQLGIDPRARITYEKTDDRIVIWDFSTGNKYDVNGGDPNPSKTRFEIPPYIKHILSSSDDELKKRYSESSNDGLSEEREALFMELTHRGINTLSL